MLVTVTLTSMANVVISSYFYLITNTITVNENTLVKKSLLVLTEDLVRYNISLHGYEYESSLSTMDPQQDPVDSNNDNTVFIGECLLIINDELKNNKMAEGRMMYND